MAEAAAATTVTRDAAHALHESYRRLRDQVSGLLAADEARLAEFTAAFPELSPNLPQASAAGGGPHAAMVVASTRTAMAEHAALLLRQLGGWLEGLVQEATFEQRMRLEAEATAKLRVKSS